MVDAIFKKRIRNYTEQQQNEVVVKVNNDLTWSRKLFHSLIFNVHEKIMPCLAVSCSSVELDTK